MFSFFKHKVATPGAVVDAIAELSRNPTNQYRIALYRALNAGQLFLGAAEMPAEWSHRESVTLDKATTVSLLTSSAPNGTALLAFTNHTEVSRRNPGLGSFAMESRSVLQLVIDQGFSALVLNPQGPWAGVPKEDIQRILEGAW